MLRSGFVRRGASLIETLVLMSAVCLAMGTLGPAITRHQGDSRLTAEMNSLRGIMEATFKYSHDDPDGVLGPVHPQAPRFVYEGYAEYGGGPGRMPYLGWNEEFDPRTRPLNTILFGANAIPASTVPGDPNRFKDFQCRGDETGWQIWDGFDASWETEPN